MYEKYLSRERRRKREDEEERSRLKERRMKERRCVKGYELIRVSAFPFFLQLCRPPPSPPHPPHTHARTHKQSHPAEYPPAKMWEKLQRKR